MNYRQMLDKLAELEQRIKQLEQTQRTQPILPQNYQPMGCKVCGLGSDGRSMGYVCSRIDCPTGITSIQDIFK